MRPCHVPSLLRALPLILASVLLPASVSQAGTGTDAGPADVEAPGDVAARIGRCFELRGGRPQEGNTLARALLAQPLDVERRIKALSCQGVAANLAGDSDAAVAVADRIAADLGAHPQLPAPYRMRALSNLGRILHGAGQIYRAEQVYAQTAAVGAGIGDTDAVLAQGRKLNNIGLIHADYLDAPQAADRHFRQAIELSRSIGRVNAPALYNFAINQMRLDDPAAALPALEEAAAASTSSGELLIAQRVRSALLMLRREHGVAGTLTALEQLRQDQASLPDPAGEAATLARMATLQAEAGHPEQALGTAQRAFALATTAHSPQETYQALQALIDAHRLLGHTDQALLHAGRMHAMKLDALRQQRLDLLADLQARNQDATSQRELERMRYEDRIRSLAEEKSRVLRLVGIALALLLAVAAVAFGLLQRHRHRQLRELSGRDLLTGLSNRHAATQALNVLAAQRGRGETRHVLFLIDIDHFKRINDTHGHHAGDHVLAVMSARLKAACRPGDLVARWGGEEFLVACADLDAAQAQVMARHLCRSMAYTLELGAEPRPVTVSLGLAPIPFFDDAPEGHVARRWDYAMRMADRALYAAKEHRDAWVAYWGARLPDDATAEAALEFPEAARGIVDVFSSQPRDRERLRARSLEDAVAQL